MHVSMTQALLVVILLFCVSAMLNAGLSMTVRQMIAPFYDVSLAASAFAASYLLVPALATGIAWIFSLAEPLRAGLILLSLTAGGEAGPRITEMARGNVPFSVGLLAAQLMITMVYAPLVLSLALPEAHIQFGRLIVKLLLLVLAPLALGMYVNARHRKLAERLGHPLRLASMVLLVLMVTLIAMLQYRNLLELFGTRAIAAAALFAVLSFIGGYVLGGSTTENRRTLAIMSCGRNASISLMIASQVFAEPHVLVMIMATTFVIVGMLLPAAYWLGQRTEPPSPGLSLA